MMSRRRPPRLREFDYVGEHRYFVTCCVAERRPAFVNQESVDCVRTHILRTCSDKKFVELVSVFMPDHLHVLLSGTSASSAFLPFMKLMRQRTAMFYRRLTGESLWQQGYFDRVLRADDDITGIARYIMENPVRAGLIGKSEDYPFSYGQPLMTGR
jgi:putative transposase